MEPTKPFPSIRVLKGPGVGESYPLTAPKTVLGRDATCGIVIPLQTISRQHAQLVRGLDDVWIEDLHSLNGTLVNGQRIEAPRRLKQGDQIEIHELLFEFCDNRLQLDRVEDDTEGLKRDEIVAACTPRATAVVTAIDVLRPPLEGTDPEVKLNAILEIINNAGASLDIDEVLPKVLDSLFRIFPQAERCYVLLLEGSQGRLVPRAMKHRDGTSDQTTIGPIGTDVARQVLFKQQAILTTDSAGGPVETVFEHTTRYTMCAPLVAPSCDPQGVLQIDTEDADHSFSQQDLSLLASIASLVGQLVTFARWHERRRNEAALQRELEIIERERVRLRAVMDILPVGVLISDAQGRLLETNPEAKAIWGGTAPLSESPDQYSLHYKAFWPETRRPVESHEWGLARTLATGEACIGEEMEIETYDGRRATILNYALPIRDSKQRIVGGVAVNVDVTQLKHVEQALKESDRRKDEFLAMLAHELRNPLAPVRNALGMLKQEGLDPETVSWAMEMMERQIEHLVRLVDDLLDVSRATQGKIKLRKQTVTLAQVVQHAVETAKPMIDLQGHELYVSLPGEPVWIEGDEIRLVQVVANLLNNASKYTDRGGKVWVTGSRVGETVVFSVRDTGIGIAPEHLPHVFDLFTQADHSLERAHGGLGIGLSLVKRLVDLHGGRVEARSEGIGRGSEFTVYLPACLAPAIRMASQHAPTCETTRRVLVVDDNLDAATTVALMFRQWKHEVFVAHDGDAALESALHHQPDIILLDIGLPGKDGYEVARRLRKQKAFQRTLIVAVTGYGQDEDRRRSREAGIDYHLVKPVDARRLKELIGQFDEHAQQIDRACASTN